MHARRGRWPRTDGKDVGPTPVPMWAKCCKALGLEHLISHPDYATSDLRNAHRPPLLAEIEAITQTHDSEYWIETLFAAGVPCGPIYTLDQTFDDPQVRHLGIAQSVYSDAMGRDITLVGQPIRMSRGISRITSPAPECGEHTEEIMRDLEYSDAEIADYCKREIILVPPAAVP